MKSLKNKTALVTGASSGIGEAFAWNLAKEGTNLILTARSMEKLERVAADIRKQHQVQVTVLPADLGLKESPKMLFEAISQHGLTVDILVNNAGFGKWTRFLSEELASYQEMMQVNMEALVQLTYLFLPAMLKNRDGGIINIASTGSFQPCPYIAVYCATKAFVLSFSEALYGEYNDLGVTVTAVCPGNTKTPFFNVANANTDGMPFSTPEQVAKQGISAFLANKNYKVTGGLGNYVQSLSARLLPRKMIVGIVAKMFKDRVL